MAVPTVITDCNATLASNSPAGTDSVGTNMDDYFRAAYGFIAQLLAATQSNAYTAFTTAGTDTAYTLTPAPAITALAANQRFRVKFNAASGATPTLAVSGLTAKNLKYYDSAGSKQAITSTQVPLNWISDVEYDGTDWVVINPAAGVPAATQAQQETGTSTTTFVSPGRQHFHPSACKFFVSWDNAGAIQGNAYNVASVTDSGTGQFIVNVATDFSDAAWVGHFDAIGNDGGLTLAYPAGIAAGTFTCRSRNLADSAYADALGPYFASGFGDQA